MKNPKLHPQVEQEVRHRLAKVRERISVMTRGIYPEASKVEIGSATESRQETPEPGQGSSQNGDPVPLHGSTSDDRLQSQPRDSMTEGVDDWDFQP